jgi:hypothetical protein
MGVWQEVVMDPKVSPGPAMPDPSILCGPPAGQTGCGQLLPLWTPQAVYPLGMLEGAVYSLKCHISDHNVKIMSEK